MTYICMLSKRMSGCVSNQVLSSYYCPPKYASYSDNGHPCSDFKIHLLPPSNYIVTYAEVTNGLF